MSSADQGGEKSQEIDLSKLSLEQLNQLKTQTEEELQTLTSNYAVMRDAHARYKESVLAVEELGPKAEGKEVLVPLTQSIYVPGKLVDANKLLVDVGTGYYVEKDQRATKDFLERKASMVLGNLDSLKDIINLKRKNVELMVSFMRQRMQQIDERRKEYMAQQEADGGGA